MNTLRFYEYAMALAEYGSFKRAAIELNISQPALSKAIAALESEYGTVLFRRGTTPLEPTASGRLLLSEARRCTQGSQLLRENIRKTDGESEGTLRIGFGPYAWAVFATPFVHQFSKKHPKYEVHLQTREWNVLPRLLRNRQVDLTVGDISSSLLQEEFDTWAVQQSKVMCFCSPDHPLAQRKTVSLQEIIQYPLALCGAPDWARDFLRNQMPEYDQRDSPATIRVNDYRLIREIISEGFHCTFGFLPFFRKDVEEGNLVALPLKGAPSSHAGVAARKDEPLTDVLREAVEIFTSLQV